MCSGGSAGGTMWSTGNADAGHATSREICMKNVGYINYGERCFDIGLHADRRNLSESRMRENLTYGSRWQGMETGIGKG